MPVQFHTTFAPQRAPRLRAASATLGGRRLNFFSLAALVLFGASAALAIFVFFYRGYLARDITRLDAELALARKSFEPEFIETAVRLNRRIEAGKHLLASHRALSPLFDVLEKRTLETVRFQSFAFEMSGASGTLSMNGEGKSFNAVALQSDIFGGEKGFVNPVFSNFSLSERGTVLFNFKTDISTNLLNWSESVISKTTPPAASKPTI
jgi:hypothetical protein